MKKSLFIIDLELYSLFCSILDQNNCVFLGYFLLSTGRLAMQFSYVKPESLLVVGFQFGAYSPVFIQN